MLLLEAGPDLRDDTSQGLQDGWQLPRPPDWGYASEPADGGEPKKLRRGRLVGGTSWFTRFAVRGSRADFDEWAALGNPGWAFDDVLPYFRRLETDVDFGDQPWHGNLGPIPVNRYRDLEMTEVHDAAITGCADRRVPVGRGSQPAGGASASGTSCRPSSAVVPGSGVDVDGVPQRAAARGDARAPGRRAGRPRRVRKAGGRRGVRLVDGTIIEASTVSDSPAGPTAARRSSCRRLTTTGPAADLRALDRSWSLAGRRLPTCATTRASRSTSATSASGAERTSDPSIASATRWHERPARRP